VNKVLLKIDWSWGLDWLMVVAGVLYEKLEIARGVSRGSMPRLRLMSVCEFGDQGVLALPLCHDRSSLKSLSTSITSFLYRLIQVQGDAFSLKK
jgi:hypothetical protein